MKKTKPAPEATTRKTTLRLPEALWLQAKKAALDRGVDLQDLLIDGLRRVLADKGK